MPTEDWLALSLTTAALWGLSTLASKPATVRLGIRRMLGLVAAGEGSVYLVLFLLLRTPIGSMDAGVMISAFLAGVTGILGYVFYYEGIRTGTVGLLGTVTAAYPAPTVLLSLAFLNETFLPGQVVGIVLVLACVVVLTWEPRKTRTNPRRAVAMALLAFLAWGLWGYFAKVAVVGFGEGNLFGFYALANAIVLSGYMIATRGRMHEADPARSTWFLGLVTMALGAGGVVALTLAYSRGQAGLVSSVTSSYPVISTIAAHFLLKERFGLKEGIAVAMFVIGIVMISA